MYLLLSANPYDIFNLSYNILLSVIKLLFHLSQSLRVINRPNWLFTDVPVFGFGVIVMVSIDTTVRRNLLGIQHVDEATLLQRTTEEATHATTDFSWSGGTYWTSNTSMKLPYYRDKLKKRRNYYASNTPMKLCYDFYNRL